MNIGIIGLGLIGGSLALDLKKAGKGRKLIGFDSNPDHVQTALQRKLVDETTDDIKSLSAADLIIVAVPVDTACQLIPELLDTIDSHAVVADTGSTKGKVCLAVEKHARREQFVAAHPIAGTEFSGPGAAIENMFSGKANIICEKGKSSPTALHRVQEAFESIGMHTVFMGAEEHDKHLAYVSHLSHVSSFLLGQTVLDIEKDEKSIFELAGSGFDSTVRLAKSAPETWTPIFEQNVEYLGQALMEYIMHLQRFHYHLMKRDGQSIHQVLKQANDIKRVLNDKSNKQTSKQHE